ncbi:MAG: glycosyltransferase family 39 protein [Chloroflexota bacterium]
MYFWGAQYWIDPFEEGYFAYLASRVAAGDHPYRDFATPYTPAFFYLHALIFKVFGESLLWQRAGVILARLVGAGLIYVLARRLAPARYAVLPSMTFLLLDPSPVPWQTHPSWYAAPSATAAALLALRYLDTGRLILLAGAGAMIGVSFAFKQNVGLLTFLAVGSFITLCAPVLNPSARLTHRWDKFEVALPAWLLACPRLAAVVLLPLAFTVALRPRPQLEYALEYVLPVLVLNIWMYRRVVAQRASLVRLIASAAVLVAGVAIVTIPWILALIGAVGREEVPLRQFVGGVDPGGYILDQWWPHPEGMIILSVGPMILAAYWEWSRGNLLRAGVFVLGWLAVAVWAARLALIPAGSTLTSLAELSILATENVNQLLPAVAAGLVVLALVSGWALPEEETPAAWLLTFGCAMFFHQYPRMDEPHLIFSAPPLMAALAWFLWRLETRLLFGSATAFVELRRGIVLLGLVCVPLISLFPVTHWRWSMLMPARGSGEAMQPHAYIPSENPRAGVLGLPYLVQPIDAVVENIRLRTSEGEPILVFPAAPMLYYLADRPNATRFNHFLPGIATRDQEYEVIHQLQTRSVRLVVLEPAFEFLWLRVTDYPILREFLRSEYRRVESFGPYEVWILPWN